MPAITEREQLSDLARPVADLIERFGFKWEFEFDHPVPNLEHRLQIRSEKHVAPRAMVAKVRAAMSRGDRLAPVILTADDYIVDGNTRVTAALANKFPTIPALILDVKYEGARESELRRLFSVGAASNARHGQGIDREEIRRAVEQLGSDPNYTATRIAALIGVTDRVVQDMMAEKKARNRAEELGVKVNGSINATRLRALGRAADLNDEPFRQLFTLAEDSGVSATEINGIAKQIREAKSDQAALGVLAQEVAARKEQIAEYKASGKSVPPASAKLRQRLGFVLGYKASPRELIEHNRTLAQDHLNAIEETITILQAVVAAQGE